MKESKERTHINIAKLHKEGEKFEIDIDPVMAENYKKGVAGVTVKDVLKVEAIFDDVRRGLRAPEHRLKALFNTTDPLEIAKIILAKGEIQYSEEHLRVEKEERFNQIVEEIRKSAFNPQNGSAYSTIQISDALKKVKFEISMHKDLQQEIKEAVLKIKSVIPISTELKKMEFGIAKEHASKSYSILSKYGTIVQDKWNADGSLTAIVQYPAGIESKLLDELNHLTHGRLTRIEVK